MSGRHPAAEILSEFLARLGESEGFWVKVLIPEYFTYKSFKLKDFERFRR